MILAKQKLKTSKILLKPKTRHAKLLLPTLITLPRENDARKTEIENLKNFAE